MRHAIAGANICHPCKLDSSIRPPRTVEVPVLQEQKTGHAAVGPTIACHIINVLISNYQ